MLVGKFIISFKSFGVACPLDFAIGHSGRPSAHWVNLSYVQFVFPFATDGVVAIYH